MDLTFCQVHHLALSICLKCLLFLSFDLIFQVSEKEILLKPLTCQILLRNSLSRYYELLLLDLLSSIFIMCLVFTLPVNPYWFSQKALNFQFDLKHLNFILKRSYLNFAHTLFLQPMASLHTKEAGLKFKIFCFKQLQFKKRINR